MKFTCIGKGHGAPAIPATRKEWEELRSAPWLSDMCRRIAAGDEALKAKLPVWTPGCAEFKNNHRAIADAVKPLRRLMLDFDEKGHSEEILTKALELSEQGRWKILLVEESVRKGTHVLISLPEEMTPQEAQERFSTDVGYVADPATKDIVSRCIYMVPSESTLYVSEEMWEAETEEGLKSLKSLGSLGSLESLESLESLKSSESLETPATFEGVPYSDIVSRLEEQMGGKPEHGGRNNFIFYKLFSW